MTAATCRCNDTGRVLADRQKRPVEVACGVCTSREVREMRALIAVLLARVDALERGGAS